VDRNVDAYIKRSKMWREEMIRVRSILLNCGLEEEIKWAKPCYIHEGKNVVILQEMSKFLALMFFKGTLLTDPAGILEDNGPNSRSARRICLTSVEDLDRLSDTISAYVHEAIVIEEAGLRVDPAPAAALVEELQNRLDSDPVFSAAFGGLTPGRRREYNLYLSGAKQAKTRSSRLEKCSERILRGKGLRDK